MNQSQDHGLLPPTCELSSQELIIPTSVVAQGEPYEAMSQWHQIHQILHYEGSKIFILRPPVVISTNGYLGQSKNILRYGSISHDQFLLWFPAVIHCYCSCVQLVILILSVLWLRFRCLCSVSAFIPCSLSCYVVLCINLHHSPATVTYSSLPIILNLAQLAFSLLWSHCDRPIEIVCLVE